MTRNVLSMAMAVVALVFGAAPAQAGEWERLGQRTVRFGADRDVIQVGPRGQFERIRLEIKENAVEVLDLKVHYANGGVQDVSVREQIAAGGYTRAIDLTGDARNVEKVTVIYRTGGKRRRGKAEVVLWGMRAGGDGAQRADDEEKKPTWVELGERVVAFGADRDVIAVTRREGTFRRIKLKVEQNGLELLDLKVHYANGDTEDVAVRQRIADGGETRTIDLKGGDRAIQKIELVYRTGPKRREGKARVVVLGLQEEDGARGEAGPAARDGEWEHLGARQVKRRGERDTIEVIGSEGRFTKIKLVARGNGIELLDVVVTYGDGSKHEVAVRSVLPEGGETRVIDLPGEARVIRKVDFVYRSRDPDKERATVHLWGRQK